MPSVSSASTCVACWRYYKALFLSNSPCEAEARTPLAGGLEVVGKVIATAARLAAADVSLHQDIANLASCSSGIGQVARAAYWTLSVMWALRA